MKFDFATDCHLDLWQSGVDGLDWASYRNEGSDVLVVTGDHSNYFSETLQSLASAKEIYDVVYYVDGNHDWYGFLMGFSAGYPVMTEELAKIGVIHLNATSSQMGDTLFIGANAWYDFLLNGTPKRSKDVWLMGSNDPHMIWDLNPGVEPIDMANKQAAAVIQLVRDAQLDSSVKKIVIMTHTSPRAELSGVHGSLPGVDPLDGAYVSITMGDGVIAADTDQKISVWCFGHTHTKHDRILDHIRYVNNCRGYESESYGHLGSPWFLVQIDTEDSLNPWGGS